MDPVTHGLASLAVARALFPRSRGVVMTFAVMAGMIADIDWLSAYSGPASFLVWHDTYLHSIFAALVFFGAIPAAPLARIYLRSERSFVPRHGSAAPVSDSPKSLFKPVARGILARAFTAPACAALLHIAMDACQSNGVMLLWPFSTKRFALDWLPALDPWILAILIACIAVPELLRLVSSEIGAKEKRPRGQTGALVGLVLVVAYVGVRATLHSNVLAAMEARTFHGETPRHASAFPESLSIVTWHCIAETESAFDQLNVNATSANTLDADLSLQLFKPQSSPALDAARNTSAAKRFLAVARIPKASIEKTLPGYKIVLRDLRYAASGETKREVAALIELDSNNTVTSQQLVWARDLPH